MAGTKYWGVEIDDSLPQAQIQAKMAEIDKARAGGGSGSSPEPTPTPKGKGTPSANDEFMSELTSALMKQSGIVSSADSKIESSIDEAIGGVKAGNAASRARIESEYGRNKSYLMDDNARSEQNFFESRAGYATPVVAFGALREYNAKSIKDLDQRKEELILAGDAAAAGKVADLQLKKLDYEQEAAQRTFNNLLGMGNFGLGIAAGERADRAQNFQESQAMSAIALQYGLKMEDGETLDSLVTKAMPFASEEQKLRLEQVRSQIAQNNAQTKAALASARNNEPLDAASIAALAAAYRTPNGAAIVAAAVKDPKQLGSIFAASGELEKNDVNEYVTAKMSEGATLEDVITEMQSDPTIMINDFNSASQIAAKLYADNPAPARKGIDSFPKIAAGAGAGYSGGVNSFLEWLTGLNSPTND